MPAHRAPPALPIAVVLLAGSLMAGCAGVAPGEVGPTQRPTGLSRLPQFEAGVVDTQGAYQPSPHEKALDCKRLTGSMRVMIARMRDSQNRPQATGAAGLAQQVAGTLTGKPGIDISAEESRERARFAAYNKLLAEKKCPTLDLKTELAAKS